MSQLTNQMIRLALARVRVIMHEAGQLATSRFSFLRMRFTRLLTLIGQNVTSAFLMLLQGLG